MAAATAAVSAASTSDTVDGPPAASVLALPPPPSEEGAAPLQPPPAAAPPPLRPPPTKSRNQAIHATFEAATKADASSMVDFGIVLPSGVTADDQENAHLLMEHMNALNAAWTGGVSGGDAAEGLSERELEERKLELVGTEVEWLQAPPPCACTPAHARPRPPARPPTPAHARLHARPRPRTLLPSPRPPPPPRPRPRPRPLLPLLGGLRPPPALVLARAGLLCSAGRAQPPLVVGPGA